MRPVVLYVVLMLMCSCSCNQTRDGSHSDGSANTLTRMDAVNIMFKEHIKAGAGGYCRERDFLFRGPLTIHQVDAELTAYHEKLLMMAPRAPGPENAPVDTGVPLYRNRVVDTYREGDELYYYRSDPDGAGDKTEFSEGHLIVREGKVVRSFLLFMN